MGKNGLTQSKESLAIPGRFTVSIGAFGAELERALVCITAQAPLNGLAAGFTASRGIVSIYDFNKGELNAITRGPDKT